ncbi:hypothetical protein I553_8981 [Mycobacterium xenopi 4042]|uniref:Uncharacterized protein n=1 Tax=Mycobacterium xenopi 4042 TaxID=1299334 RepID=X8AMT5_MYCXE|nr:hypothetical protein I553_8981 [Mycobacterium xenopi 4042]
MVNSSDLVKGRTGLGGVVLRYEVHALHGVAGESIRIGDG